MQGIAISGVYGSVGVKQFADSLNCPVYCGAGTPLFNTLALTKLAAEGYAGGLLSAELNIEQINRLNIPAGFQPECLAYGALELMQSRICQVGVHFSQKNGAHCKRGCAEDNRLSLVDRTEVKFTTLTDQFCNLHLFNARLHNVAGNCRRLIQGGVSRFRVDARLLENAELKRICEQLAMEINDGPVAFFNQIQHTRGHLLRGVD